MVLGVVIAGAAVSAALEFAQAFLPDRVMSPSDVVAETIGTAAGAMLWLFLGRMTAALVRMVRPDGWPGPIGRLFLGYVPALLIWRLLPLDLTLDPSALHRKYLGGGILPMESAHLSLARMAWDAGICILIYMPVGVAAGVLWASGERPRLGLALASAIVIVFTAELGRVFVLSAVADLTRLAPGILGVTAGIWMAHRSCASSTPDMTGKNEMRV
jgi:hypothetical protein